MVSSVHSAVKLWKALGLRACSETSQRPRHVFESLQRDVIAECDNAVAASWEQLLRDVQHHVLAMSGMPCVRRVSQAARDEFDAVNNTRVAVLAGVAWAAAQEVLAPLQASETHQLVASTLLVLVLQAVCSRNSCTATISWYQGGGVARGPAQPWAHQLQAAKACLQV